MTIKLKIDKELVDTICESVLAWEEGNFDKWDLKSFMEFLSKKMDRTESDSTLEANE